MVVVVVVELVSIGPLAYVHTRWQRRPEKLHATG